MRLNSIRMEGVGAFRSPVEISDLGPGLNVLAAPNETGKSTLFRGAYALLAEKRGVASQKLPLDLVCGEKEPATIAAEFEIDGVRWQLMRRFHIRPGAALTRAGSTESYRNEDVNTKLAELIARGRNLEQVLPLTWVGQGQSFEWYQPDEEVQSELKRTFVNEAAAVTGQSDLGIVRKRVAKRLDTLIGKPAPSGERGRNGAGVLVPKAKTQLRTMQERARDLGRQVDELSAIRDQGDAFRADRLAAVARQAQLDTDGEDARLANDLAAQSEALQTASGARAAWESAKSQVELKEHAHKHAARSVEVLDQLARNTMEMQQLGAQLCKRSEQADAARDVVQVLEAERQNAAAVLTRVEAQAETQAAAEAERVQLMSARERISEQLVGLETNLVKAAELDQQIATVCKTLKDNPATPDALRKLTAIETEWAGLNAAANAEAPTVRVRYTSSSSAPFQVNGAPLADGAVLSPTRPFTIEVPGLGAIEIEPALTADSQARDERLLGLQKKRDDHLKELGVSNEDDARQRAEERVVAATTFQGLQANREALSQDGCDLTEDARDALQGQLEACDQRLADLVVVSTEDDHPVIDVRQAKAALNSATEAHQNKIRMLALCEREIERDEDRLAVLKKACAEARESLPAEIAAALPKTAHSSKDDFAVPAQRLGDALATAATDLELAKDTATEYAKACQSPETIASWRKEIAGLEALIEQRRADRGALREQIAHLDGQLQRIGGPRSVTEELETLVDDLEEAKAAVVRTEVEAEGLCLLEQELAREMRRAQASVIGPFVDKITALAAPVLALSGRDAIQLAPDLANISVRRHATMAVAAASGKSQRSGDRSRPGLSGGTREQIALIARLAASDQLRQSGITLPIVLDDALVFSDDRRREKMFQMLADVATQQQVVVLTCHQSGFAPLIEDHGATVLHLRSAHDATVEAA